MPIRQKSYPVRYTPRGLVDAFDATDKFEGASVQMSNLIFDPSNPEIMESRPGVTSMTTFASFTTPGVISVQTTIGNVCYGLIASGRNSGKDEPFAFDHSAGTFITISGITNGNSPTTQSTTGDWTPPTMAMVGVNLIVTHPGFPGGATKFGWFDLTTPATPVWNAGDTTTNTLPSTPLAVANFGNRAYFACSNQLWYTDVLAFKISGASQELTVGDGTAIEALCGLPIQTTSAGIIAALIVFKETQCWQVTGDAATSNLALNYISLNIGCDSPRSIAQSPMGIYFASIAGPYIIDQYGILRQLTHSNNESEPDINAPFQNITYRSRVAAGYSAGIYRICMNNLIQGVQAKRDYWFDEKKRRWNGPHTFPYEICTQHEDHFILCSNANPAQLIHSEKIPSASTVYTDLGVAFSSTLKSSTFPKRGSMNMKQVVESTMELASSGSPTSYGITALDESGNTLNNCQVSVLPAGSLWGSGVWGGFSWASALNIPVVYGIPWTLPVVFKKMAILVQSTATTSLSFGTFYARYQDCGYTNRLPVP